VRLLPTPPRPIGVQRWSTRRVALLLLVLLVLVPAGIPLAWMFAQSSASPGGGSAVTGGSGSCTQIEELWLQAQSVPSASRIPCLRTFPVGNAGALYVRNGESVLEVGRISVDRNSNAGDQPQMPSGPGVRIRLTAACDVQTVGEGRIVAPGIRRFQVQEPRGMPVVADVFLGGCVTYRPPPGMDAPARLLDQAARAVVFRTRDELRQALRRRSNGRLELDPQGG
jgi:hypothetical protein